jgi:hypothetical protein
MQKRVLMICLFLSVSISVFSQKVSVSKIDESRSTSDSSFDNKCEIELKISGDEVRKYKFVKISKITKATDDQDLDLINEDHNDFEYKEIDENAKVEIETKIPARKAKVIKELSGELSLYSPTVANGAIIRITNYQTKTNINLLPNAVGVQIMYLTKESLEKFAKGQKLKKEEELKKLPEITRKMAEGLMNAFEGFSNSSDDPNQATFYVEGDKTKLVDLYFEDANGKRIERNGRYQNNNIVSYSLNEKPNPNCKLVLNIETATSVKKVPFKLLNIELP